jgi:hypothetical protein
MSEWFQNMWLTMYFFFNKKKVMAELSEHSKEILSGDNRWIDTAAVKKDCLVRVGWRIACCSKGITEEQCTALRLKNPTKYVTRWDKDLCGDGKFGDCKDRPL